MRESPKVQHCQVDVPMIPGDLRRGDLRMSSEIPRAKSSPSMSFVRGLRLLWAAWPTVVPLVCLVASWFALRRGFFGHVDIPLWDETEYLASGWRLLHHAHCLRGNYRGQAQQREDG